MTSSYDDTVLLTIHGVWSDNSGLHKLGQYCKHQLPGLHVVYVNYGDQGPVDVLDWQTRLTAYKTVRSYFLQLYVDFTRNQKYPHGFSTKIYVVAHSFGTLALLKFIETPLQNLVIDNIVLIGSILPQWTEWDHFIDTLRALRNPPINIVRPFDLIPRRAHRLHNERATSGTRGFSAMGSHIPTNHFKTGGHTTYDPDDFDDVVDIIKGTFSRGKAVTETMFVTDLSRWQRIRLNFCRKARLA